MGVDNIITFDAHDPRVVNAIPLNGFENVMPSYQFIKGILKNVKDITIDADHLMIISPDEGATNRAIYLANVLGVDMGMFYKRRDYSRIVDGRNPIVAHEFLGTNVEGKDVLIIDDMISSGDTVLKISSLLKERGAGCGFHIDHLKTSPGLLGKHNLLFKLIYKRLNVRTLLFIRDQNAFR